MNRTLLVVEDEENLLEVLKYNLEREGYNVLTAVDGEQGLEVARASRPDMVVLDIMLPELGGLEVCRILRRESNVPILMLTAKGEEIDRVLGLELGADDYVAKPFSIRELMARVKAMSGAPGWPRRYLLHRPRCFALETRRVRMLEPTSVPDPSNGSRPAPKNPPTP